MTGGTDVIGAVAVAIGAAATLYAALHLLRRLGVTAPRWVLPAGIGLSMIAYSVWSDYAWFGRAADRLPAGSEIVLKGTARLGWAPWTYLAPVVVRFAAIDPATTTTDAAGIRRAAITLVERRGPTLVVPQEFDCARRMIRPVRGEWAGAPADDPAFAAVCRGAAPG